MARSESIFDDIVPACRFISIGNEECPIVATQMIPPRIGELLFVQGEDDGWRVKDVQYQFRAAYDGKVLLICVIVEKEERPK